MSNKLRSYRGRDNPNYKDGRRKTRLYRIYHNMLNRCTNPKSVAPVIVVVVRGGLVQEVRSTNPYTQLFIADYDTDGCDASQLQQLKDAAERGNQPDMHVVY